MGIKSARGSVILLFVLHSHDAWQAHHRAIDPAWTSPCSAGKR
jgi:hypothetical protein